MPKVFVNLCSIDELLSLPGVGQTIANFMMALRHGGATLNEHMLRSMPSLKVTQELLNRIDFSTSPVGIPEVGGRETPSADGSKKGLGNTQIAEETEVKPVFGRDGAELKQEGGSCPPSGGFNAAGAPGVREPGTTTTASAYKIF